MRENRIYLSALIAVIMGAVSFAQETVSNASVEGRVTDPSGAVVTGAKVTARHIDTNLTTTMETNGEGRFRFPYLRVGQVEVSVEKQGFATEAQGTYAPRQGG